MRWLVLAAAAALSGCGMYPVAMYAHHSDPSAGRPLNHDCDPTADFAGFGGGLEYGRTRVYLAVGAKLVRQCVVADRPHEDRASLGGSLVVIQDLRRKP